MMKFTDLDFDCLENVLEYLELPDLLNVADSTKRLRKAAELVYAQKYDKRWVTFGVLEKSPAKPFLFITGKVIKCKDSKTSLQLLRCLGCVISRIHFEKIYNLKRVMKSIIIHQDQKLCSYINEYCAEYLKKLVIETKILPEFKARPLRANLLEYFDKPFKNMVDVKLFGYNFTEKTCLIRLFPRLHHLHGKFNESFYRFNTNYFPNLKRLSLEVACTKLNIQNEMVLSLLQLNPHLNDLTIRTVSNKMNVDLIWDAVNALQNVENFDLLINPITSIQHGDNFIHMPRVKRFKTHYALLEELPAFFLPFTFGQLETIDIQIPYLQNYNSFVEQFFEFIDRHPKITRISIATFPNFGNVMDWSRLARSLPLLVDVTIDSCWTGFSSDIAIEFIANSKMLKRLLFEFDGDCDSFQKQLGNEWEVIKAPAFNFYTELKRKN